MKLKLFLLSIFALISLVAYQKYSEYSALKSINSYESCISSSQSTISKTYPHNCTTKDMRIFKPIESDNLVNNVDQWSIYNNTKYGYSFKYPEKLVVIRENAGKDGYIDPSANAGIIVFSGTGQDIDVWMWLEPYPIDKPSNLTLEDFIKRQYRYEKGIFKASNEPYDISSDEKVIDLKNLVIDGKNVVRAISQVLPDQGAVEDKFYRAWIEYIPGKILILQDTLRTSTELHDNILSTFKFTN